MSQSNRPDRAYVERICREIAGKDPKTNADLTAWKRLGGSPAQIEGRG